MVFDLDFSWQSAEVYGKMVDFIEISRIECVYPIFGGHFDVYSVQI